MVRFRYYTRRWSIFNLPIFTNVLWHKRLRPSKKFNTQSILKGFTLKIEKRKKVKKETTIDLCKFKSIISNILLQDKEWIDHKNVQIAFEQT